MPRQVSPHLVLRTPILLGRVLGRILKYPQNAYFISLNGIFISLRSATYPRAWLLRSQLRAEIQAGKEAQEAAEAELAAELPELMELAAEQKIALGALQKVLNPRDLY